MTFEEHKKKMEAAKVRLAELKENKPKWYQFRKLYQYNRAVEDAECDIFGHALGMAYEAENIK